MPPPTTAVPIPAKPKTDSIPDSLKVKRDSIKPPIGRFADPATYEIGPQYEWNREQLFATGALTVVDLLDRIPGITTYRSGWLATPQTATYNADFRRVRIFYDGVELDALDNTTGGLIDLSTVQLWTLEHLSIERTDLVVNSHGHMRAFYGNAYVPSLVPPNFSVIFVCMAEKPP